ncbi:MAG TPA: hypothetical protein VFX70_17255 [Mycobacteriales bacterium]|nr:hypothetical protein [Mycobacteriales bacterium]
MHQRGMRGFRGARPGGWQQAEVPPADDAVAWFSGRLPDGWFTGEPDITIDRDEIVVVGELPPPETSGTDEAARSAAEAGRISRFREDTREERMAIAREAEHRYGRKVAWGARIGATHRRFTSAAVPVMTRLRQPDRQVLDTLVDAGVARSRSDALAWCVRLVGEHADSWLRELREAMTVVDQVRTKGPEG